MPKGAFATCHCLTLPESEPGYYFWRDRSTGELTRRSEWFVTKTPVVRVGPTVIKYLISFVLPRFCEQTLRRSWKRELYGSVEPWVAKLDTIVHELYHIDPEAGGIRQLANADGTRARSHGPGFYTQVAEMVRGYLATNPDPAVYEFLQWDFAVAAGAFRRRRGHDVPEFSVLPAALSRSLLGAAGGRGREGRALEAADPAAALH